MSEYAMSITCGNKTYNISVDSDGDVYFSSSKKTGGLKLEGIKNVKNNLISNDTDKTATNHQICQAIQRSLS